MALIHPNRLREVVVVDIVVAAVAMVDIVVAMVGVAAVEMEAVEVEVAATVEEVAKRRLVSC